MVEIGDTTRYKHRGALTAFAGVDLRANESGDYVRKGSPATKKGSSHQRKTLFQIMEGVLLLVIPSKLSWMKSEPKGSLTKAKYREVEIALQEGKHRDYRYKSCFESAPVICGFIKTEELGKKLTLINVRSIVASYFDYCIDRVDTPCRLLRFFSCFFSLTANNA